MLVPFSHLALNSFVRVAWCWKRRGTMPFLRYCFPSSTSVCLYLLEFNDCRFFIFFILLLFTISMWFYLFPFLCSFIMTYKSRVLSVWNVRSLRLNLNFRSSGAFYEDTLFMFYLVWCRFFSSSLHGVRNVLFSRFDQRKLSVKIVSLRVSNRLSRKLPLLCFQTMLYCKLLSNFRCK